MTCDCPKRCDAHPYSVLASAEGTSEILYHDGVTELTPWYLQAWTEATDERIAKLSARQAWDSTAPIVRRRKADKRPGRFRDALDIAAIVWWVAAWKRGRK